LRVTDKFVVRSSFEWLDGIEYTQIETYCIIRHLEHIAVRCIFSTLKEMSLKAFISIRQQ
jgi:hypothetical protein